MTSKPPQRFRIQREARSLDDRTYAEERAARTQFVRRVRRFNDPSLRLVDTQTGHVYRYDFTHKEVMLVDQSIDQWFETQLSRAGKPWSVSDPPEGMSRSVYRVVDCAGREVCSSYNRADVEFIVVCVNRAR